MRTLESRHYLATASDIESLAQEHVKGASAPATYLKILVANVQAELGFQPRERSRVGKLEDPKPQLAALDTVHTRFYTIVLRVAASIPNAAERNAATNFARSAKSTLRSWIAAGNDIQGLAASRVTKASLRVKARKPRPNPAKRVTTLAARLETILSGVPPDPPIRAAVEKLMNQLAGRLMEWGGKPVRDPATAAKEDRPLKTGAGIFWRVAPTVAAPEAAQ